MSYGEAALEGGFAFARAGVRCMGAVFDAGLATIAAFDAAHEKSRKQVEGRAPG
jgi:hypothetical protein